MTKVLDDFIGLPYKPYGRGPDAYDCWGLVRDAYFHLYHRYLLPSFTTIDPMDKVGLSKAVDEVYLGGRFHIVDQPEPGAIVTAWSGGLCVHVGLMVEADGRLWILEAAERGVRIVPLHSFTRLYIKVVFYVEN